MGGNRRHEQLSALISEEMSEILRTKMKDPRLGFVSITGVRVTADLRVAKIYVSVLGEASERKDTIRALTSAQGFLRHELAQRLTVRHVPEISFELDDSIERGSHVLDLIRETNASSTISGDAKPEIED
ncbi:MAG TPA: 30S ribosome-binding factor RbfA [Ktedonobacterales bacterium]